MFDSLSEKSCVSFKVILVLVQQVLNYNSQILPCQSLQIKKLSLQVWILLARQFCKK